MKNTHGRTSEVFKVDDSFSLLQNDRISKDNSRECPEAPTHYTPSST